MDGKSALPCTLLNLDNVDFAALLSHALSARDRISESCRWSKDWDTLDNTSGFLHCQRLEELKALLNAIESSGLLPELNVQNFPQPFEPAAWWRWTDDRRLRAAMIIRGVYCAWAIRVDTEQASNEILDQLGVLVDAIRAIGERYSQGVKWSFDSWLAPRDAPAQAPHGTCRDVTLEKTQQSPMLDFIPGGFIYRGKEVPLAGKARAVLKAIAEDRLHRCTEDRIRQKVWGEGKALVSSETIRFHIGQARIALRKAIASVGEHCDDPLPCVDHGENRAWHLAMP